MPWKPSDAPSKTKKAKTPKQRRMWRDIANSVLAKTGSDSDAIREANGVIKKRGKGKRK